MVSMLKRPRLNQEVKRIETGETGIVKFIVGNVVTISLVEREKIKSALGFFHPTLVTNISNIKFE